MIPTPTVVCRSWSNSCALGTRLARRWRPRVPASRMNRSSTDKYVFVAARVAPFPVSTPCSSSSPPSAPAITSSRATSRTEARCSADSSASPPRSAVMASTSSACQAAMSGCSRSCVERSPCRRLSQFPGPAWPFSCRPRPRSAETASRARSKRSGSGAGSCPDGAADAAIGCTPRCTSGPLASVGASEVIAF